VLRGVRSTRLLGLLGLGGLLGLRSFGGFGGLGGWFRFGFDLFFGGDEFFRVIDVVEAEPVPGILLGGTESARSALGVAREARMNLFLTLQVLRVFGRFLGILGIFIGRFTLNVTPNATGEIGLGTTHLEFVVLAILRKNRGGTVHKVIDALCRDGILQLRFLGLGIL